MATSGTLKSYVVPEGKSYVGAYWFVEWTSNKLPDGVTQIKWRLGKAGRSSKPTWVQCRAKLKFTAPVGTITYVSGTNAIDNLYDTGLMSNWDGVSYGNGLHPRFDRPEASVTSGVFNITHNSEGEGKFVANFNVVINAENGSIFEENDPVAILDNNYTYERCQPPTKVTIEEKVQKPGGEITISWEGAQAGKNNAITAYYIQYKIGEGDWSKKEEVYTDETFGSVKIAISSKASALRGSKIIARVCTVAKYGANSTYTESKASCKVNVIPPPPEILIDHPDNQQETKVPYNGERTIRITKSEDIPVKVSINGGNEQDCPDVIKLFSQKGEITYKFYSSNELERSETIKKGSITFEFYSFDGLERSKIIEEKFVCNINQPKVSISATGSALFSNNNNTENAYVIEQSITALPENGQADSTYTFWLQTQTDGEETVEVKEIQSGKEAKCYIEDIRTIKKPGSVGYCYCIKVTRNDGIEEVSAQTGMYYVTKLPNCKIYNDKKGEAEGLEDSNSTLYFSNKIKAVFDQDEGYPRINIQLIDARGNTVESKNLENQGTWNLTTVEQIKRGSGYTVRVKPYSSSFNSAATKKIGYVYRVLLPSWQDSKPNIGGDGSLINPLTSASKNLAFRNFFGTQNPNSELLKVYGCEPEANLTLEATYNSIPKNISLSQYAWKDLYSADTCHFELNQGHYNTLFCNLGIDKNLSDVFSIPLTLSFVTIYGDKISANFIQKIKFVTTETIPTIANSSLIKAYWPRKNGNKPDVNFLCEKCCINFKFERTNSFHEAENIKIQVGDRSFSHIIYEATLSATSNNEYTITLPKIDWDISKTYIRLKLTTKAKQTSDWLYLNTDLQTKQLHQGRGAIIDPLWKSTTTNGAESSTVEFNFSFSIGTKYESGYTGFTARLYDENGPIDLPNSSQYIYKHGSEDEEKIVKGTSGDTKVTITGQRWAAQYEEKEIPNETAFKEGDYYYYDLSNNTYYLATEYDENTIYYIRKEYGAFRKIKIKCTTYLFPTDDEEDFLQCSWNTPYTIIYKESPTLSYRKNRVGINYTFSDGRVYENSAFVVSSHGNKNFINFISPEREFQSSIYIPTGDMFGFIIDCGAYENIF